jgi:hypothetical protein
MTGFNVALHKIDRELYVFQSRMCEVGRRNSELLDPMSFVLENGALVLFTSINDRSYTLACQTLNISSKRVCTDDDVWVDMIPPTTSSQDSA